MSQKEYSIDGHTFRYSKMEPTKILALTSLLGSKKFEDIERSYQIILDYVEISLNGQFQKMRSNGILFPTWLEDRADILQKLILNYIKDVVTPVFKKPIK